MTAQHLSVDELAEAAEGLLDPERAALAESHLAGCPDCQAQSEALREVTETLRAEPAAPMPEAVAHRLYQIIAAENARRRNVVAEGTANPLRPSSHARR
jgi:anti-sigma factor RsiW